MQILVDGKVIHCAPEAVLFDKDGTLIDIHHYWLQMIRLRTGLIVERWFDDGKDKEDIAARFMEVMGADQRKQQLKPEGPVGIKPRSFIVNLVAEQVREEGVSIDNNQMEELFAEVDRITSEDMSVLLRLLPGVEELFSRLSEGGVNIAIVSNDITARVHKSMEILQLDRYVDEIIGSDQVNNSKPAPDLVWLALECFDTESSKVIVVGDHMVDVDMGITAGVGANIGVLTGLADHDSFEGRDCWVVPDLTAIQVKLSVDM